MPFLRLDNFGAGGLASDPFEEALSPSQWQILGDIDFSAGDLISGGSEDLFATSPVVPRYMFFFETGGTGYLFVSDGYEIHAYNGTEWVSVLDGLGGGKITSTVFLGSLVVNSETDGPFYWDYDLLGYLTDTWSGGDYRAWTAESAMDWTGETYPDDTWATGESATWAAGLDIVWAYAPLETLIALPGWFEGATCKLLIAYKNFLVAIGVDDPNRGGKNDYLVCWSDVSPAGGIPGAWIPDASNLAGDTLVLDTPGTLSGAALMRDDLMIYKTDSVYRMTYVPGSPLVMSTERVLTDNGIDYPGAVCSLSDVHYLATRSGLQAFNGQQSVAIDFSKIQESVRQILQAAESELVSCTAFPGAKQVWISYRRNSSETNFFGILKYDIQHGSFTTQSYEGLALTSVCSGSPRTVFLDSSDTWVGGEDATWAAGSDEPWALSDDPAIRDTMFLSLGNSIATYNRFGACKDFTGAPRRPVAERHGIRLTENSTEVILRGVYPLASGAGELVVAVGKNYSPWGGGEVRWSPPRSFKMGSDRRLPYRLIGDNFALRISSEDGLPWRLSAVGIEFDVLGRQG